MNMQIDPHQSRRPTMKLIQQQHKFANQTATSSSYHHESSRKSAISPSTSDAFYLKSSDHQKEGSHHLEGLAGKFKIVFIFGFLSIKFVFVFQQRFSNKSSYQ